jgi:hypothetical protein
MPPLLSVPESEQRAFFGVERMEPTSGLEPLTCRLRIIGESYRCSS